MIQTVKGKIDKDFQGRVLCHEHISCTDNGYMKAFGKKWLKRDELSDYAARVLSGLREKYGVTMLVDGTPVDLGRDVKLLSDVSEKSGVHIVASSGTYWFPGFVDGGNTAEEIAEWFISDCLTGMEDTDVLPGILKCASGRFRVTDEIEKRHRVIGITGKETNLPIYVHCEHREDDVFTQTDILLSEGTKPEKIIVGHTAIRPEADYLEKVLDKGFYISMDQCFCFPSKMNIFGESLVALCHKGFADKILISNDYCIHSDFPKRERNGLHLTVEEQIENLAFVYNRLKTAFLEAGGSELDFVKMTETNIKNALDI